MSDRHILFLPGSLIDSLTAIFLYTQTQTRGKMRQPGMPKTLNDLAADAATSGQGIEALGILKADVDNLGLLMACGLRKHLYTVSRMACLSRQLDHFFSLFLPDFLSNSEKFKNIYTVVCRR